MSRVRAIAAILAVLAVGASACDRSSGASDGGLTVVASFYPLAVAVERSAGDLVTVVNLTPAGVEPHDLELAPDDLEAVVTADLVVYLGGGFQPAVEDGVQQAEGATLDALQAVGPLRSPPPGAGEAELTADPHVWLDPARYSRIVGAVANALARLDPAHADAFRSNAEAFQGDLSSLDAEFHDGLATCARRMIVTSHAAFGYLAESDDLEQVPIAGLSPDAEPSAQRIAELRTLVQEQGITTIFTEDLVSPKVAETLADEAGVETAVLNPLEGLTQEQVDAGDDYLSIMRGNLEILRTALDCT